MKEKWYMTLYLLWFSYLVISAIIMFGNGFLLSRKTLSDTSECLELSKFGCDGREIGKSSEKTSCSEVEKIKRIVSNPGAPMACPKTKNRVVLLLVDALRYDFTEYNPTLESPLYYQNRLPIIKEVLDKWPKRSRLYRFMADPPTTTFQRVKALATGSLPTFIDVTSNFAAMELQEDNFVDQVIKSNGKVVLLGDDTWARILPERWARSHALYSFHTWDLDTVDMEVDSKIYDELRKNDWDLLIAHYLGVDHAGHRYGPNHPEMARKLNETNSRLQKILQNLPYDVILYVIGDHGMTETGDHGGESKAERTAACFAYRGAGLGGGAGRGGWGGERGAEIQQMDLAATASGAAGRPPPAPSLGAALPALLPPCATPHALLLLTNNLKQVMRYLVRYGEESQQVPLEKLAQWINSTREQIEKAANIDTEQELEKYAADVRSLIVSIKLLFRDVWVEFDSLSMLRALLLLLLVIFFNWLITEGLPTDRIANVFASTFVPTGMVALALCVGSCYTAYYFKLLEDVMHAIFLSTGLVSGVLNSTLVVLHWDGISQRWCEGRSQFYERFSRAALIASAAVLLSNSFIIEEGASLSFLTLSVLGVMAWRAAATRALLVWAGAGAALAVSRNYRGCREEQGDCWTEGAGVQDKEASRAALVVSLASVAAVVAICRRWLGREGYLFAATGVLVCGHWALGWRGLGSAARSKLLARIAWFLIVVGLVASFRRGSGPVKPLVQCTLLVFLGNALALGISHAPGAALALLAGFLTLQIVAMMKNNNAGKLGAWARCGSGVAAAWALQALYWFYGTGHHATLGHVRWAPAFHAGDPHAAAAGPFAGAAFLLLDLYGMQFMYGLATPLLVLWGRGVSGLSPRSQAAAVFSLALKFGLCFAVRSFAITIAATIHCRHLMIWGVFTPKLLFEAGSCGAALAGALLGTAITMWHLPSATPHKSS